MPIQEYYVGCTGRESVINYPLAPNSRIWFVDPQNRKVYAKVRDINGGAPYIEREFDMNELAKPTEEVLKVDENEIGALRNEVRMLAEELASIKPIIDELKS